jgi:uncharacterized protein
MVFIDTSALYAVLDRDDENHRSAAKTWERLLTSAVPLLTHNYVLIETAALVQHRLGVAALRAVHESMAPVIRIEWIQESQHRIAMEMVITAARRKLSLVDCASFVLMREHGVSDVFCFDAHFNEQGFRVVGPESAE